MGVRVTNLQSWDVDTVAIGNAGKIKGGALATQTSRNEALRSQMQILAQGRRVVAQVGQDHQVSACSKILENYVSPFSATVVERLLAEDAIIIERLNCDEFAMGASNESSYYGPVNNFADKSKVSGGSSGGAAVAVQAGLCLAALGTDTGGSARQPASFCGVVGLKPTYGRVSRHGIISYASSFDQVGPITNNVEDAAILLEVISGSDQYDSTVSSKAVPHVVFSERNNERKKS